MAAVWEWSDDRHMWEEFPSQLASTIEHAWVFGQPSVSIDVRGNGGMSHDIIFSSQVALQLCQSIQKARQVVFDPPNSALNICSHRVYKVWMEQTRDYDPLPLMTCSQLDTIYSQSESSKTQNRPNGLSAIQVAPQVTVAFATEGVQVNLITGFLRGVRRRSGPPASRGNAIIVSMSPYLSFPHSSAAAPSPSPAAPSASSPFSLNYIPPVYTSTQATTSSNPQPLPFANPFQASTTSNPLALPFPHSFQASPANPFQASYANPFQVNPFQASSPNPFQASSSNPSQASSANPFQASSANPFQASSANPFQASSSNPFQASSSNPSQASSANPLQASSANPLHASSSNPSQAPFASPFQASSTNPPNTTQSPSTSGQQSSSQSTDLLYDPETVFVKIVGTSSQDCSVCCCALASDEAGNASDNAEEVVKLSQCPHSFHLSCIQEWFKKRPSCPECIRHYGRIMGTQPVTGASMTVRYHPYDSQVWCLEGYPDTGVIEIYYCIESGVQGPEHPNPGLPYRGTVREAFLPHTPAGEEILELLKKAWDRRLIFRVGRSITTGRDNCVVWGGIHHKTRKYGGSTNFGYPDETYFARVKGELQDLGVL